MKCLLQCLATAAAFLCVFPGFLFYRAELCLFSAERVFPGWSQAISLLPGLVGVYLRRAFYRLALPECGKDIWISFGTLFSHNTAKLGSGVYIGPYCVIGDAILQNGVRLASHVSIINGGRQHDVDFSVTAGEPSVARYRVVSIGRDSWVGERAVVMADIGDSSIVGAGAVVTKPVPNLAVVAGVPARILRVRTSVSQTKSLTRSPPTDPQCNT